MAPAPDLDEVGQCQVVVADILLAEEVPPPPGPGRGDPNRRPGPLERSATSDPMSKVHCRFGVLSANNDSEPWPWSHERPANELSREWLWW